MLQDQATLKFIYKIDLKIGQEHVNFIQVELEKIFLQLSGTGGNRRECHTSPFPSTFIIIMCMKYIPGNEENERTGEFTSYE